MKTINELIFAVVITNGDPALVENDEHAQEVKDWLDRSSVNEVTDEDEFKDAAAKLDFSEQVPPRHIYSVRNSNPNESGYIVFSEDYGD